MAANWRRGWELTSWSPKPKAERAKELEQDLKASNQLPVTYFPIQDTLPESPKQHHQQGTKCSNAQDYGQVTLGEAILLGVRAGFHWRCWSTVRVLGQWEPAQGNLTLTLALHLGVDGDFQGGVLQPSPFFAATHQPASNLDLPTWSWKCKPFACVDRIIAFGLRWVTDPLASQLCTAPGWVETSYCP